MMTSTPIDKIRPYATNAKKHPKKQVQQIANSIKTFGFNQPVVVDEAGVIIVGHGRYEAAKLLGLAEIPVLTVKLSEEKTKAYRLADNKLNESDWIMDLVIDDLKGLSEEMFRITGFDLDLIVEPEEKDDVIPVNPPARTKLGDIWALGEHRLVCGDSTSPETVALLMNGKTAGMVFMDPPYNALKSWKKDEAKSETRLNPNDWFANDNQDWDQFDAFIRAALANVSGHSLYICCDYRIYPRLLLQLPKEYQMKHCIVWVKNMWGLGKRYRFQHEFVIYATLKDAPFWGDRSQSDVWQIAVDRKGDHKTPKPVALPTVAILNSSQEGSIVLDLFLGSGTTLLAAEKTRRVCYGVELDPKYVDVCLARWEQFTGQKAEKIK